MFILWVEQVDVHTRTTGTRPSVTVEISWYKKKEIIYFFKRLIGPDPRLGQLSVYLLFNLTYDYYRKLRYTFNFEKVMKDQNNLKWKITIYLSFEIFCLSVETRYLQWLNLCVVISFGEWPVNLVYPVSNL